MNRNVSQMALAVTSGLSRTCAVSGLVTHMTIETSERRPLCSALERQGQTTITCNDGDDCDDNYLYRHRFKAPGITGGLTPAPNNSTPTTGYSGRALNIRSRAKAFGLYRRIDIGKDLFLCLVNDTSTSLYTDCITLHPVSHFPGGSDNVSSS
jgi:hypothetical protein